MKCFGHTIVEAQNKSVVCCNPPSRGTNILDNLLERIEGRYIPDPNSGCWLWTHSLRNGYGAIGENQVNGIKGKTKYVHRILYEKYKGPIPIGYELDHKCRIRSCVNPDHLEAVSHLENVRRGNAGWHNAIKTHCPKGHSYSGYNLKINSSKKVMYSSKNA